MSANNPQDTQNKADDAAPPSASTEDRHVSAAAQAQNRAAAGVELVETSSSAINSLFWLFAIISFVAATILPGYLQDNWQPASNFWIRLGVIAGLVVLGFIFLFVTKQGRGFFTLLSDARTELRRVTWPSKDETLEYTWKTLTLMVAFGFLIWLLDVILNPIIGAIIGH